MISWDKPIELPLDYTKIDSYMRRLVRLEYIRLQEGICFFCNESLNRPPDSIISSKPIDWSLFPPGFMKNPIHLQHDHKTGMTEGAVHAYCNAYMWQYEGR